MALAIVALTVFGSAARAVAQQLTVLHSFDSNGSDGAFPFGTPIFAGSGNLYGATPAGGDHNYSGTVFEMKLSGGEGWTERVLYNFGNGKDGVDPATTLVLDSSGNLYGTTEKGGIYGFGMAFELVPQADGRRKEKVLHQFGDSSTDGTQPICNLIFDAAGNLYGTTRFGGAYAHGTVFELLPSADGQWTEKILYSFGSYTGDGWSPWAGLVMDAAGNLYGMASSGGSSIVYGAVFELMPSAGGSWTEKLLHSFTFGDGAFPGFGALILDRSGKLYGTTFRGGNFGTGDGIVFALAPDSSGNWTERVLHSFGENLEDGQQPYSGVVADAEGNLYGTTSIGGIHGKGIVFELSRSADGHWTKTILHTFGETSVDASGSYSSLLLDRSGNLYGTTDSGGVYNNGTVFEIKR